MLTIPRTLFDEDHAAFRDTARRFILGKQGNGNHVPGIAFARKEAVGGRAHAKRASDLHGGTLGIADARIMLATGRFAAQGQIRGSIDVDLPGMPEIEIGKVMRQQIGIGEAIAGVRLGMAGDGSGMFDGLLDRIRIEVGCACRTLALAEEHGQREPAIAIALD